MGKREALKPGWLPGASEAGGLRPCQGSFAARLGCGLVVVVNPSPVPTGGETWGIRGRHRAPSGESQCSSGHVGPSWPERVFESGQESGF